MAKNSHACAFNPSTVVIVDDNHDFLKNIILQIDKSVICKTFANPVEALEYITEKKTINVFSNVLSIDVSSESYTHSSTQLPMQLDVSKLYTYVYNKDRFSEISVVVVDYDMPQMNGAQFSRQLRNLVDLPIKIIMLTGEADTSTAVDLFNDGLIDKFIIKGRSDLEPILNKTILEMQKSYYCDLSQPIVKAAHTDQESALNDPAFQTLFNQVKNQSTASSFYLLESSGSFIFLDDNNSPTWLIIKTLNEVKEMADQLEDAGCSPDLVASMRKAEIMPYCYNDNIYFTLPEDKLNKHIYQTQKLSGNQEYCYFITKELADFPLDKNKILSFNKFLSLH